MNFAKLRRFWTGAAAAALLLAGGCATVDPEVVRAQTTGKTVAVASDLGELQLVWVGTTVFNNEYGTRDISAWGADRLAVALVVEPLRASQRLADVLPVDAIVREGSAPPRLPPGQQADFLLLVETYRTAPPDPIFHTNLGLSGIGVVQRSFMGIPPRTHPYLALQLRLIDLRSNQVVATSSSFKHFPVDFHLKSGGKATFSGPLPVPTLEDAELERLREPMLQRLREFLAEELPKLGLL